MANILAIQKANPDKDVYIIGGKQLYEATESIIERVYLTRIKGGWFTDTRINLERMLATFQIKSVSPGDNCTYETCDRKFFFG